MTKSNRHKKQRKQEKAKTQLTGVKKLAKSQNVVNPTLKVKKILIREQQLRTTGTTGSASDKRIGGPDSSSVGTSSIHEEEEEEGFTRRRQSVQDLLSSSNHHNINIRKEAILGLQEIATSNFKTILKNLDRVVTKISSSLSDQETSVRKENLKLAEIVLSKTTSPQLTPFWSNLIAHLKCALTHLTPSVRYAALSFIELLVTHHSELVSESSTVILTAVLGLVTRNYSTSSSSSRTTTTAGNTTKDLTIQLNTNDTDDTERIRVFKMLCKCLSAVSNNGSSKQITTHSSKEPACTEPTPYLCLNYPFGYCLDQDREQQQQQQEVLSPVMSSYSDRFYNSIVSDVFRSDFETRGGDYSNGGSSSEFWVEFLYSTLPVIINSWVGVVGGGCEGKGSGKKKDHRKRGGYDKNLGVGDDDDKMNRTRGLVLNERDVDSLLVIVELFGMVVSLGCNENRVELLKNIRKSHAQNLNKYLFSNMPYVALQDSRRKHVVELNLKLFSIFGELGLFRVNLEGAAGMKSKVLKFVQDFKSKSTIDPNHVTQILEILRFVEVNQIKHVCTDTVVHLSESGHYETVAKFLLGITKPGTTVLIKRYTELVSNLDWEIIVSGLVRCWGESGGLKHNRGGSDLALLLELITVVNLKSLCNDRGLKLTEFIPKFKELLPTNTNHKTWDAIYRMFVYSTEGLGLFIQEFGNELPDGYLLSRGINAQDFHEIPVNSK